MKKLTFIFVFFIFVGAFSQEQGTITGKILDLEMGSEPILLANVQLKGLSKVTQTNFHGNFEFKSIPAGEHTLIVSYAGYEELEIPVMVENGKISKVKGGLSQKTLFINDVAINKTDKIEFIPSTGLK